mmetsp:Transcript_6797/g.14729  ORF Transcript_6797/g.14729 Transcript_6797/m.14729 type:complete len:95 (+) Transcript_6797:37-321(+)
MVSTYLVGDTSNKSVPKGVVVPHHNGHHKLGAHEILVVIVLVLHASLQITQQPDGKGGNQLHHRVSINSNVLRKIATSKGRSLVGNKVHSGQTR